MELVRAAALTGYFPVAEALRLDTIPLLRRSGLTRAMLDNPEQMLPARPVIRLLEESAAASNCLTFGLRMAELRGSTVDTPSTEKVYRYAPGSTGPMVIDQTPFSALESAATRSRFGISLALSRTTCA